MWSVSICEVSACHGPKCLQVVEDGVLAHPLDHPPSTPLEYLPLFDPSLPRPQDGLKDRVPHYADPKDRF